MKHHLKEGSAICGNCGKPIEPNSSVAVMHGSKEPVICHANYDCSPAGNCRYGFWGNGKLVSVFGEIEQC